MPKTPTGKKRPADVIGNAVTVMKIATGEIDEAAPQADDGKNSAAVELGRKGGAARAKSLSAKKAPRNSQRSGCISLESAEPNRHTHHSVHVYPLDRTSHTQTARRKRP